MQPELFETCDICLVLMLSMSHHICDSKTETDQGGYNSENGVATSGFVKIQTGAVSYGKTCVLIGMCICLSET